MDRGTFYHIENNMELNLKERLAILSSLPGNGDFIELMFIRQITEMINIKVDENEKYNINVVGEGDSRTLVWNELGNTEYIEFNMSPEFIKVIYNAFRALDKRKALSMDHFTAVEKIYNKAKELGIYDNTTN